MTVMTTNESARGNAWDGAALPAVMPSTVVTNTPEWGDPVDAVLTLRVAVTRDMLVYALSQTLQDENPDGWSVEEIRESTEMMLAAFGAYGIESDTHLLESWLRNPESRERVRALYRAIDRAYPPAPSTVTFSGNPVAVRTACEACSWQGAGPIEAALGEALNHSEHAHLNRPNP